MFELLVIIILGLSFGSFASALIYRIPQGLPWANSRSQCTSCGITLGPRDLIPVISWAVSGGKCRNCGAKVSSLYPVLEVISCAVCLFIFFFHEGQPYEKYALIATVPFLLALTVIDLQHKILPNVLVFIIGAIGAIYIAAKIALEEMPEQILVTHGGGAILYALFAFALGMLMRKLLKKEALGMGDVKFFAVSGLWLGAGQLGNFCILAGIFGVLLALLWKVKFKQDVFPFGPALIASFLVILTLSGSLFFEKAVKYFEVLS